VNDLGRDTSQFLVIDPVTGVASELGSPHENADIEALDQQPNSGVLFATGRAQNGKDLYNVDRHGGLIWIGSTGFQDVDALSFHPTNNTLWGWARRRGLIQIDTTTGGGTLVYSSTKEIEGLTWNQDGSKILAAQGSTLWVYDPQTQILTDFAPEFRFPGNVEALEIRPDGELVVGIHGEHRLRVYDLTDGQPTLRESIYLLEKYSDIESIAWPALCSNHSEPTTLPTDTPTPTAIALAYPTDS
jgi:WD40 repeat protein